MATNKPPIPCSGCCVCNTQKLHNHVEHHHEDMDIKEYTDRIDREEENKLIEKIAEKTAKRIFELLKAHDQENGLI